MAFRTQKKYVWLGKQFGGYRRDGYKRHMQTKLFREEVKQPLEILQTKRAYITCMEVEPRYCHRRFISARLERKGVEAIHIIADGQKSLG